MPFKNPYIADKGDFTGPTKKVGVFISIEDWFYIKSLRLNTGTVTTTISILFNKLANELTKHNLNSHSDADLFEHLVSNCSIILPRTSLGEPVGLQLPNPISGGTKELHSTTPGDSNQQCPVLEKTPRKRSRKTN